MRDTLRCGIQESHLGPHTRPLADWVSRAWEELIENAINSRTGRKAQIEIASLTLNFELHTLRDGRWYAVRCDA